MTQFQFLLVFNLMLTCASVLFALHTWIRKEYWKSVALDAIRAHWNSIYQNGRDQPEFEGLFEPTNDELICDFTPPDSLNLLYPPRIADDDSPVSFSEFKKIVDQRKYGRTEDQA